MNIIIIFKLLCTHFRSYLRIVSKTVLHVIQTNQIISKICIIIPAFKKEYKPKLFFLLAKSTDHSFSSVQFSSVQFISITQSCPTLCNPMNHNTPGLPVHHQLQEFTQTHVHWVGDAIQPSHPLSLLSPGQTSNLKIFMWKGRWENGWVGDTRNLSPYLDNIYISQICLIQELWSHPKASNC